jgi:hypothetical protein
MNIFLKAKHWQLFLLNFAIPFVLYLITLAIMIGIAIRHQSHDPYIALRFLPVFIILGLISAIVQYGWTWAAGIILNNRLPEELKLNTVFFKICFFYPIVYLPLLGLFIYTQLHAGIETFSFTFLLIIPFHLFTIFCSFYCMYFVARVIKTTEYQRYTTVSDYIAEFFMIWFYFVGIWFLQPKINKMIDEPGNQ